MNVNVRKVVKINASHEQVNQNKIEHLQKENLNLKDTLKRIETELALKRDETQKLNLELDALKKAKSYEPKGFVENAGGGGGGGGEEFWKNIYAEVERLKIKLANAENELKLRDKEFELKQVHLKHANEKRFNELVSKHKYEINKLIGMLTGDELLGAKSAFDGESLLDDPLRMRLILNSRNKYSNLTQTIERQKEIISGLTEKLSYFSKENITESKSNSNSSLLSNRGESSDDSENLESVVMHYETQLKMKNREIEKFRRELDQMLNLLQTLQT
jgi:hypothetical protein